MKKLFILFAACIIAIGMTAQTGHPYQKANDEIIDGYFVAGDTLFYDANYKLLKIVHLNQPKEKKRKLPKMATLCGLVRSITSDNRANIKVFSLLTGDTLALIERIASGPLFNKPIGSQYYINYYDDSDLMETYKLYTDESTGYQSTHITSELLVFSVDGSIKEDITFVYDIDSPGIEKGYVRGIHYHRGCLQCIETYDNFTKKHDFTYYDTLCEVTSSPSVTFAPYFTMPQYDGGIDALVAYLRQELKYPHECEKKGIQGCVVCQFIVDTKGKPQDVVVVRSSGNNLLDKEAVRVVREMPNWKPGKKRGKPVRVSYTLPINFRLE